MQKRVFVVHGWGDNPSVHWLPWLKNQLEKHGFVVSVPQMPNPDEPDIDAWVSEITEQVGTVDEATYFVGHSIGCQAIMRYLERQEGKKAGGCVLVAGWFKLENLPAEEIPIAEPWQTLPINYEKVLSVADKFTVFISDTDDYGAVEENAKIFKENLHATVHVVHDRGHFTTGDGITEVPEVVEAILNYIAS